MKDNFLLKQLAQAVVDSYEEVKNGGCCLHCNIPDDKHKSHCIVLVAEQILKGNEDE